jgi:hypothetical protein
VENELPVGIRIRDTLQRDEVSTSASLRLDLNCLQPDHIALVMCTQLIASKTIKLPFCPQHYCTSIGHHLYVALWTRDEKSEIVFVYRNCET